MPKRKPSDSKQVPSPLAVASSAARPRKYLTRADLDALPPTPVGQRAIDMPQDVVQRGLDELRTGIKALHADFSLLVPGYNLDKHGLECVAMEISKYGGIPYADVFELPSCDIRRIVRNAARMKREQLNAVPVARSNPKPNRKRRTGRPRVPNCEHDRIVKAWNTKQHRTYEDCARSLGSCTARNVKLAVEREHKRKKADAQA